MITREPELTYGNVVEAALRLSPDFQRVYDEKVRILGPSLDLPHVFFGSVIEPILRNLLDDKTDRAGLDRFFGFFDAMANSPDLQVVNLLQVGILEWLVAEPDRLSVASAHMGVGTREIARRSAIRWGRRIHLPE